MQEKDKTQPPATSKKRTIYFLPADETCQSIPGFVGYYVNPLGNVYSKSKQMKPLYHPNKADRVKMEGANGRMKKLTIARAIALPFLPNHEGLVNVVMLDRNKHNCALDNIAWFSTMAGDEQFIRICTLFSSFSLTSIAEQWNMFCTLVLQSASVVGLRISNAAIKPRRSTSALMVRNQN